MNSPEQKYREPKKSRYVMGVDVAVRDDAAACVLIDTRVGKVIWQYTGHVSKPPPFPWWLRLKLALGRVVVASDDVRSARLWLGN